MQKTREERYQEVMEALSARDMNAGELAKVLGISRAYARSLTDSLWQGGLLVVYTLRRGTRYTVRYSTRANWLEAGRELPESMTADLTDYGWASRW